MLKCLVREGRSELRNLGGELQIVKKKIYKNNIIIIKVPR